MSIKTFKRRVTCCFGLQRHKRTHPRLQFSRWFVRPTQPDWLFTYMIETTQGEGRISSRRRGRESLYPGCLVRAGSFYSERCVSLCRQLSSPHLPQISPFPTWKRLSNRDQGSTLFKVIKQDLPCIRYLHTMPSPIPTNQTHSNECRERQFALKMVSHLTRSRD